MKPEFVKFNKMYRVSRDVIVTEKLDGTNGQIFITDDGQMFVGSRNRWITPQSDNYGFARWCEENKQELMKLGPGRHFGEWWGKGIQRGYGLDERRFSLFNTYRWSDPKVRPACCDVVPILYEGVFDTDVIDHRLSVLERNGSFAAPGFMRPEGIVIFHKQGNFCLKKTLGGDGHKSLDK